MRKGLAEVAELKDDHIHSTKRKKEQYTLKMVEIECAYCGKKIYIQGEYIKGKMFCTLGCMDLYKEVTSTHRGAFN